MKKYEGLLQFIDIGANLLDSMFSGMYHGKEKHKPDLQNVLQRSWESGLKKIIITGTNLEESKAALELAQTDDRLYSTVGCHPTNCNEFEKLDPSSYLESLLEICKCNDKIVAVGEFGLDYDRISFCSKDTQLKYFEYQLSAFQHLKLPLFLHCRNAADDLIRVLNTHHESLSGGVVHSFDGSKEEAENFMKLGFHIGINGCSLKTENNLKVLQDIPADKILIETDSPWCEIRPTHAGFQYIKSKFDSVKKEKWEPNKIVKGRNEPCNIVQILEILSAMRDEDIFELGETVYKNTEKLFFSKH